MPCLLAPRDAAMIDPISAAIVAAVFAGGWLTGRHARLTRTPKPIQPICLCKDPYGTHDPKTGECGAWHLVTKNHYGHEELVQCACLRYTGPQPVEQYWVPPSADMDIVTAPRPVDGGK